MHPATAPAQTAPSSASPLPVSAPPGTTIEARLTRSRYGSRMPALEVRLPRGAHHRLLNIALHQLAAHIEVATPLRESWLVQTKRVSDGLGHVFLELLHDTDSEAQRGMALLQAVRAAISLPTTPS